MRPLPPESVVLKVGPFGNEDSPLSTSLLRVLELAISGDSVPIDGLHDEGWRRFLPGAGQRRVEVVITGLHRSSSAERRLQALALSGLDEPMRLDFALGDTMTGRFLVTSFKIASSDADEPAFSASLASSGPIEVG